MDSFTFATMRVRGISISRVDGVTVTLFRPHIGRPVEFQPLIPEAVYLRPESAS